MTSLYLLLARDVNPGPFTRARSGVASALMMFSWARGALSCRKPYPFGAQRRLPLPAPKGIPASANPAHPQRQNQVELIAKPAQNCAEKPKRARYDPEGASATCG
jgi:hypothetical protein